MQGHQEICHFLDNFFFKSYFNMSKDQVKDEDLLVLLKDLTSFLYTLYEFHPDIGINREGLISLLCLECWEQM